MKLIILSILAVIVTGRVVEPADLSVTSPVTFPPPALQRRADQPASDDVWNRAQCKGGTFVKIFPMSDADAAKEYSPPQTSVQSRWTGDLKSELAAWGWSDDKPANSVCQFDEHAIGKGWVDAAKQLGISLEGWKDIWCYKFSHGSVWNVAGGKRYKVDGKEHPVSTRLQSILCSQC